MIDREKVIYGLEIQLDDLQKYADSDQPLTLTQEQAQEIISLLKEQEAEKPVVDIDTWKCGNCGHTLEHQELLGDNVLFHEQYNYCPECGKKVKWNE